MRPTPTEPHVKEEPVDVRLHTHTWPELDGILADNPVVVVPVGAVEQHGPHLPLETDFRLAEAVAQRSAELAAEEGVRVFMTPPVWLGYSPHHMDFAGTVTLRSSTFMAVITDIATSLWHHGFRKIALLNGHGGNGNLLASTVQALRFEHGVRAVTANYWSFATEFIAEWRESGPGGIDHACEMEMSLMSHVRPDVTRPEQVRDASWMPSSPHLSGDLVTAAPVGVAWSFAELTDDGTLGDPSKATAERGEELFAAIVDAVKKFLVDFHGWDWEAARDI